MRSRRTVLAAAAVAWALGATSTPAAAQPVPPPPTSAQCMQAIRLACYSPQQIERAYNLGPLYAKGFNGKGSTIVIVDPFGSPTIGNDLTVYDRQLGLPDPPAFRVLQPEGPVPPYDVGNGQMVDKAGETTLDVEWAHAIAPGANILLVETPVMETATGGGFSAMMMAEEYVIRHGLGDVISQSFSLPEQNFGGASVIRGLRKTYVRAFRRGITVLGATNDSGATGLLPSGACCSAQRVVQWPSTDPLVTAVGGTRLRLDAAGRRTAPDVAWNDTYDPLLTKPINHNQPPPVPWSSTGGLSTIFARPSYQNSVRKIVGRTRGVPDVSMSASITGAVLIYSSYPTPQGIQQWGLGSGTSEATPEFAGIVAIADQYARKRFGKKRLGLINPALYRLERRRAPGIVDVTAGNNTVGFRTQAGGPVTTVIGYSAMIGYDLVTGVGTINAARFVPELARVG
jgi:subtilase family serine protease